MKKSFTKSQQVAKLEEEAQRLELSTSHNSYLYKFDDAAAAEIAKEAAEKFRARAKALRIEARTEGLERAKKALEEAEKS